MAFYEENNVPSWAERILPGRVVRAIISIEDQTSHLGEKLLWEVWVV